MPSRFSHVAAGLQRQKDLQHLVCDHDVFQRPDLIPTYLLINNLGLLDSMWAVILPGAFSVWNMIIARTYYQGVPRELREAADVDGASGCFASSDPAARLYAGGGSSGPMAVRGHVEQLL